MSVFLLLINILLLSSWLEADMNTNYNKATKAVEAAFQAGYTHLDGAAAYSKYIITTLYTISCPINNRL